MLNLLADNNEFDLGNIMMLIVLALLIVAIVVFYVISSKKRKKQEDDAQALIDAVKPGNKVKTIGGICGIVVEVDAEENTFVLETGTETSGKSYIKFDKQAIYQTDAVVEKPVDEVAESAAENKTETVENVEESDNIEQVPTVSSETQSIEDDVKDDVKKD